MADSKQFEEMLECLVNEDKVKAEELFHNIVVEKSREIYENLLEDDLDDEEVDETSDEEVDEASDDEEVDEASDEEVDEASEDDDLEEDFNLDEFEVEGEDDMDMDAGDPADAMMSDIADMGDEEGEGGDEPEGDVEERVGDLEDALDELKAEFEDMMAGEEGGEDDDAEMPADDDMDTDSDDEEGDDEEMPEASDEEVDETSDDEVEEGSKEELSPTEQMREYVEKITPKMGDNGANTKSAVAGANNMGNGTASNLAQGADEKGMKAASPKDIASGNVNVPGGKASKSMTTNAKGHGAEKKGAGDTAANKKSTIGS
jgi:hypothetical protein